MGNLGSAVLSAAAGQPKLSGLPNDSLMQAYVNMQTPTGTDTPMSSHVMSCDLVVMSCHHYMGHVLSRTISQLVPLFPRPWSLPFCVPMCLLVPFADGRPVCVPFADTASCVSVMSCPI